MIGLDFYQDQENSLDILIKFQDEHQQPESHTHEELFLPIAEISVTSHPTAPLLNCAQQPSIEEQSIADELMEKMRLACEEQEEKAWLLLGRMNAEKDGGSAIHQKMLQECPERGKEGTARQKRKIIRKKHAEWYLIFSLWKSPLLQMSHLLNNIPQNNKENAFEKGVKGVMVMNILMITKGN